VNRVFLGLSFVFAVGSHSADDAKLKDVYIAAAESFTELTNQNLALAQNLRLAMKMAIDDYAPRLANSGYRVRVKEFDFDREDVSVLIKTREIVASDVVGVVGYNTSNRALLAAPIVQKAGLPMISASATATRISDFKEFVHTASVSNLSFARTLAQAARRNWKAKKAISIAAVDCSYCTDLTEMFKDEFFSLGGKTLDVIPVLSSQTDFKGLVSQLKSLDFDVVLNPNHKILASRLISAIGKAGINKPYLLADGWGSLPETIFFKIVGDVSFVGFAVDHWHPEVKGAKSSNFSRLFKKISSREPDTLSALWYDSTAVLLEALLVAKKPSRIEVEKALSAMKTFQGVTGNFDYSNGGAPLKSTVLLQANGRKYSFDSEVPAAQDVPQKMGARP